MNFHYGSLVILLYIQNAATQSLFDLLGGLGVQGAHSQWNQPPRFDTRLSMMGQAGARGPRGPRGPRPRGHGAGGGGLAAPVAPNPFGATEEQMAEILSESAKTNPERQRIDSLIRNSGGKLTGSAAPLNFLIQEYLATPPVTDMQTTTQVPKTPKKLQRKKGNIGQQSPLGPMGPADQHPGYFQQGSFPSPNNMMHPQSQLTQAQAAQGGNMNNMWQQPRQTQQPKVRPGPQQRGPQQPADQWGPPTRQQPNIKFGPPPPSVRSRLMKRKQSKGTGASGLSDGRVKKRTGRPGKSIAAERIAVIQKRIDALASKKAQGAAGNVSPAQLEHTQNEINALNRLQTKLRGGAPAAPPPQFAGPPPGTRQRPSPRTANNMNAAFIDHNFRQTFGTMMSQAVQGKQQPSGGLPPSFEFNAGPNNNGFKPKRRRQRPQGAGRGMNANPGIGHAQLQPAHPLVSDGGIEIAPPVKGSTAKPPMEGDVRMVNGVKYVFSDVDGFDLFQWAKAPPGTPGPSSTPPPQATQPPA